MGSDIGAVNAGQVQFHVPLVKRNALKTLQELVKYAMLDIRSESRIHTLPRAELGRQIAPRCAGSKYPAYAVEKRTDSLGFRLGTTGRFVMSQILDRFPLGVRQRMTLHHLLPDKVAVPEVLVSGL